LEYSKFKQMVISYFILLTMVILSSCKDNGVSPISGAVQGKITGSSVSGIKIYLFNTLFKADTVNISNNRKALIDSTVTDGSGNYMFENLSEGKYGVVPVLSNSSLRINYDESSPNSYEFMITGTKRTSTVNFISTYLPMDESNFQVIIKFKNFKALSSNWWYLSSGRRYVDYLYFTLLSPTDRVSWTGDYDASKQSITYSFPYGSTSSTCIITNKIHFFFTEVSLDSAMKNVYNNSCDVEYDFTQTSCPAVSTFEYDWSVHTFNRIQ
jgi:hypothetical protein